MTSRAETRAPGWIWTNYWGTGRRECFTTDGSASRLRSVDAVWRSYFSGHASGSRILDLGTGAGAVARIALDVGARAGRRFEIEGVDIAALPESEQCVQRAEGSSLRFVGNTDLAKLPSPDNIYDSVVSQFGLEYAELAPSVREIARVLKPSGRGLFVMHHSGSAITSEARAEFAAYAAVVGDGDAFELGREVFSLVVENRPKGAVLSAIRAFRASVQKLRNDFSATGSSSQSVKEIVSFLSDMARTPHLFDPADALQRLEQARLEILAWSLRKQAQLTAARDAVGIGEIRGIFHECGLRTLHPAELRDDSGSVLAWQLALGDVNNSG